MTEPRPSCIYMLMPVDASLSPSLVRWIATQILPCEPGLRRWLSRAYPRCNADDVVQEAYCRLADLASFAHIDDPRRYLYQTARNVVLAEVRRERVVRIESLGTAADLEAALGGEVDERSPERIVSGRSLLGRVDVLLARLPERARAILRLRKLDGLSQRDVAARLGITETIVENDLARGLRTILAALTEDERAELPLSKRLANERPRIPGRN